MDKRQDIQSTLDEAWFALLTDGGESCAIRLSSSSRKFGAGLATVHSSGKVSFGGRTFSDSEAAADFIQTGSSCTFIKKEDGPE